MSPASPALRTAPRATGRDRVTVLVVDDHRVFAELLSLALNGDDGIECVALACSSQEGLSKIAAYDVDVVVLDVELPDGDGIDLVERVLALRPGCRVVVLTAHPRRDLATRAFASGAVAFLAKDERLDDLLDAVRGATRERPLLARTLQAAPGDEVGLTPRENDVLTELACGRSAAAIAGRLGLSSHTVRDHIKAILGKLDARSQLEAVLRAIELGLVRPGRG